MFHMPALKLEHPELVVSIPVSYQLNQRASLRIYKCEGGHTDTRHQLPRD
jgi:hypothetical protein